MALSQTRKSKTKKDLTDVNRMKILNLMHKEWHIRYGKPNESQFDFMADIAGEIAQKLPSDLLLKEADELTLADIMESEEVQNAELTRRHVPDIPRAKKKPRQQKSGGMKRFVLGFAGLLVMLILAATLI